MTPPDSARTWSIAALVALGLSLVALPTPAQAQSRCIRATQNKIAWDYKGSKRWAQANLQRLCRGVDSKQPAVCFRRVMHGKVNWGGGTQWKWENAIDLCEQSRNAQATISCFKNAVRGGQPWKNAIAKCDERRPAPTQPPIAAPPPQMQVPTLAKNVTFERNIDRPGSDYRGINIAAKPRLCANKCAADPRCKAYTYVKPGVQGPSARCYLKDPAPGKQPNNCCTSGIKRGAGARPPLAKNVTFERNVDRPGSDYRGIDIAAKPRLCANRCAADARCKAYTYVKPGVQGPSARCYLKDPAPGAQPNNCCTSGIKRGGGGSGVRVSWNRKPGAAKDIGVGPDRRPWVIGTDRQGGGYGIYRWKGGNWTKMPGAAVRIDVGPGGQAWVVNDQQYIYRWQGARWQKMPGRAYDVGVGSNGAVWVIGTDPKPGGYGIYKWAGKKWRKMPGAAVRIDVGPAGNAWVVNKQQNIYRWIKGGWKKLPGKAYDIGVGARGAVWVIGTNKVGGGYSPYRLTNGGWKKANGGLTNITVGPRGAPLGTNERDRIFFGKL